MTSLRSHQKTQSPTTISVFTALLLFAAIIHFQTLPLITASYAQTASAPKVTRSSIYEARALSMEEVEALTALEWKRPTEKQRALLFMRNDAVNRARLSGWITDEQYQAAQADYAELNKQFAEKAAKDAGATLIEQQSTSKTYSAGTDSDYITKVKSPKQVEDMQKGYNKRINQYLSDQGLDVKREDWHNRLDTDFMADPEHVNKEQFKEIARLNNDAYKRPLAAEYEAISRAEDGTKVKPGHFTDYTSEMRDFVHKKQKLMKEMKDNPIRLESPHARAEWQKLMAQEQKYISRVESAAELLKNQQNLPISPKEWPELWKTVKDQDGNWVLKRTIAAQGAKRSPTNFGKTGAASAVAENSLNRALEDMADAYADAARKNPAFSVKAAEDIAEIMETLPPSQKGAFLDALGERHGAVFTGEVAGAMRNRATKSATLWTGKALKSLEVVGTGMDLYEAAQHAQNYLKNLEKAMDPNLTDAEAAEYFEKAQWDAAKLAGVGGLSALAEAYPPVGMAFGVWTISYQGGKYVLANTETGQVINRAVTDYADRHGKAYERASCEVSDFLDYFGKSECQKMTESQQNLLGSVIRSIKEGRKELAPGKSMRDVIDLIRQGRGIAVQQLLVDGPELEKVNLDALVASADVLARETEALCASIPGQIKVFNEFIGNSNAILAGLNTQEKQGPEKNINLSEMTDEARNLSSDAEALAGELAASSDSVKSQVLTVCEKTEALQSQKSKSKKTRQFKDIKSAHDKATREAKSLRKGFEELGMMAKKANDMKSLPLTPSEDPAPKKMDKQQEDAMVDFLKARIKLREAKADSEKAQTNVSEIANLGFQGNALVKQFKARFQGQDDRYQAEAMESELALLVHSQETASACVADIREQLAPLHSLVSKKRFNNAFFSDDGQSESGSDAEQKRKDIIASAEETITTVTIAERFFNIDELEKNLKLSEKCLAKAETVIKGDSEEASSSIQIALDNCNIKRAEKMIAESEITDPDITKKIKQLKQNKKEVDKIFKQASQSHSKCDYADAEKLLTKARNISLCKKTRKQLKEKIDKTKRAAKKTKRTKQAFSEANRLYKEKKFEKARESLLIAEKNAVCKKHKEKIAAAMKNIDDKAEATLITSGQQKASKKQTTIDTTRWRNTTTPSVIYSATGTWIGFNKPRVKGILLDKCLKQGGPCGQATADAYCRAKGYQRALDYTAGTKKSITRYLNSGQKCTQSSCRPMTQVICEKDQK